MPLYNFIKILVSGDLSYIGTGPKIKLEEAWDSIFSEYMALSNDITQNHFLSLVKEIAILTNKLIIVQSIVDQFSDRYSPAFGLLLNQLGFRYKYTEESFKKDLKLTISNAKAHLLRLDQSKKNLEALQSKGGTVKESDYDNILVELSKFTHYHIDKRIITVAEFVAILNNFKAANKSKNGK